MGASIRLKEKIMTQHTFKEFRASHQRFTLEEALERTKNFDLNRFIGTVDDLKCIEGVICFAMDEEPGNVKALHVYKSSPEYYCVIVETLQDKFAWMWPFMGICQDETLEEAEKNLAIELRIIEE